jgi:hypothetical protein
MATKKCDYCGKEYDESFFGTLDNGSEACFNCIKDEEERVKAIEKRTIDN